MDGSDVVNSVVLAPKPDRKDDEFHDKMKCRIRGLGEKCADTIESIVSGISIDFLEPTEMVEPPLIIKTINVPVPRTVDLDTPDKKTPVGFYAKYLKKIKPFTFSGTTMDEDFNVQQPQCPQSPQSPSTSFRPSHQDDTRYGNDVDDRELPFPEGLGDCPSQGGFECIVKDKDDILDEPAQDIDHSASLRTDSTLKAPHLHLFKEPFQHTHTGPDGCVKEFDGKKQHALYLNSQQQKLLSHYASQTLSKVRPSDKSFAPQERRAQMNSTEQCGDDSSEEAVSKKDAREAASASALLKKKVKRDTTAQMTGQYDNCWGGFTAEHASRYLSLY